MNGEQQPLKSERRWRLLKPISIGFAVVLAVYFCVAYIILPADWMHFARKHPSLDGISTITQTSDEIPGDPLNVALHGTATELRKIMLAAKWAPADPLTFRSCLEIAEATVFKRPYDDAPVSNLFLFGRKEDFAFEQPVGDNPRQRHHVRFWRSDVTAADGRSVWVGSATFDERVGLSTTTGQITHHIAPDVDQERSHLFGDLSSTGDLSQTYFEPDFQKKREGKNGGGDRWQTDGQLMVGVIRSSDEKPAP